MGKNRSWKEKTKDKVSRKKERKKGRKKVSRGNANEIIKKSYI